MIQFVPYASSSKGNLYTLDDGHTKVLIEMGLSIKSLKKALNYDLSSISFALLSHSHHDHSKSVKEIMKAGIDVYTGQETIDALGLSGHRIHPIKHQEKFTIGTWTILPLASQHDALGSLAFLMVNSENERFLFATDTYYLAYKFKNLHTIAVECNYIPEILEANMEEGLVAKTVATRLLESHFSLPNVKNFLQATDLSKVQEIVLIHLSSANSDSERIKREIQELTGKIVRIAE